jgi:dTDP-4-amino-4,6-dideoxygalactose transaminase
LVEIGVREMAAAVWTLGRGQLARYAGPGTSATDRFERELESFVGVRHALAVNSGTSALICALAGLRIGPGDEVLVPAYTWVASAAAVVAVGAVPVLVEIDESLTIDPSDVSRKITSRTRAVIPVHMLNLVCDMDRITSIAKAKRLVVIEDACQAIGVTYRGNQAGSIGHAGAFSFNQHKNIRSGEGGAVVTNDEGAFVRAAMFHDVGSYIRPNRPGHSEPSFVGMNMRMPELSSAILRPQLARLERKMAKRMERRAMILDKLERRRDIRVSPHHDPGAAVGLTVSFDDPEEAALFAMFRGVNRLIDTGRHVYTNWQPILGRRTFDPRANPWDDSAVEYSSDSCRRTLEVLERTCSISLDPDTPMPVLRLAARRMAAVRAVGPNEASASQRQATPVHGVETGGT